MSQEEYERIEAYLQGEMTSDQKREFELTMLSNPKLADEVTIHKGLKEAIGDKEIATLSRNIRLVQNQSTGVGGQTKKTTIKRIIYVAAASVVLMLGILYFTNMFSTAVTSETLFAKYLDLPNEVSLYSNGVERSSDPEDSLIPRQFREIEKIYLEGDYQLSWELLAGIDPDKLNKVRLQYVKGLVQLQLKDYQGAMENFEQAKNGQDMSEWYLALIYIKLDQVGEAMDLLQEISRKVHPRSEEAAALLVELNTINSN